MDAFANRVIKGYEIREKLGAGGMGAVYRAHQPSIGREVAIKVILPYYANQPDFIRRFETEAQVIARLEHPHIVPLYDYWRDPEGAYLVMRWLRGNLRASIQHEPWKLDAAARLLDQIAAALTVAHRDGIVHRDIKPDNILLDEDDNAYLADFGIAQDIHRRDAAMIEEKDGWVQGSPEYMTPEAIQGGTVTARLDLYSLGFVLYEMLTGEKPYKGTTTPAEVMQKHLSAPLPMLSLHDSAIPASIDEVLQTATAKDPSHRYPSALRFAAAFRAALPNRLPRIPAQPLADALTEREIDVLRLMIDGLSNAEIAARFFLTPGTVKWYVKQIYTKLDAHSRQQAIDRALSLGLTAPRTAAPALPQRDEALDMPTLHGERIAAAPSASRLLEPDNPYKGLRAFQENDADDFFGRATLTERLLSRLSESGDGARFLALVGPSGSGKSSVVRAGLIPALRKGALSASPRPFIVDFLPGTHPLEELEAALLRVAINPMPGLLDDLRGDRRGLVRAAKRLLPNDGETELILIVDQFEEVFTLVEDEATRVHFIDNLLSAVSDPRGRVRVILTLRADFYDKPLMYPRLAERVRAHTEVIIPLSAREMEQAMIAPAERVGVHWEAGLAATVTHEVGEQPGTLPLLQYALTELFERREGLILTLDAYKTTGGVLGALARRADEIYGALDPAAQNMARQLFLRLVTLGEGAEDTRRRATLAELNALGGEGAMEDVINAFAQYRLLTLDRDPLTHTPTVEIAHEALLREWGRFREWLIASREDVRLERRLGAAAAEWNAGDASFLASGMRLGQFETWAKSTDLALTADERAYLEASLAERTRGEELEQGRAAHELAWQRRAASRLRYLAGVLIAAFIIVSGLAVFALNSRAEAVTAANMSATQEAIAESERDRAETNFVRAERQRLAAEAQNAITNGESGNVVAALALRSLDYGYSETADTALRGATRQGIISRELVGHTNFSYAVNFSPDGTRIVSSSADAQVRIWDVVTGETVRIFEGHDDLVQSAIFSPDGGRIASGDRSGTIHVWNVATGEILYSWTSAGYITLTFFSPDGQRLYRSDVDGTTFIYDTETGEEVRRLSFGEDEYLLTAHFHAEGMEWLIAGTDNTARFEDSESGDVRCTMSGHTDAVWVAQISSDGTFVVTASDDQTARVWDIETCEQRLVFEGHTDWIGLVDIMPDNGTVITAGNDLKILRWSVETGGIVAQYRMLTGGERDIDISPDGRWLITTGFPNLPIFDLAFAPEPRVFTTALPEGVWRAHFAPDGETIFVGAPVNAERFNLSTGERVQAYETSPAIRDFVPSPDGTFLFVSTDPSFEDNSAFPLYLLDSASGEIVQTFVGHTGLPNLVDYSPDGTKTASAGFDETVRIWDVATGEALHILTGHTDQVGCGVFSPDGTLVVSGSSDGTVRLWDVETGEPRGVFQHEGGAICGTFSPDGQRVLSGGLTGTGIVWDVATGERVLTLNGHSDLIWGIDWSPDGRWLATGAFDSSVRIWDAVTGEVVRVIRGGAGSFNTVEFSADSQSLLTADGSVSASLYQVNIQSLIDTMCAALPGDLDAETLVLYDLQDSPDPCE